jgi:hypothetical protein
MSPRSVFGTPRRWDIEATKSPRRHQVSARISDDVAGIDGRAMEFVESHRGVRGSAGSALGGAALAELAAHHEPAGRAQLAVPASMQLGESARAVRSSCAIRAPRGKMTRR